MFYTQKTIDEKIASLTAMTTALSTALTSLSEQVDSKIAAALNAHEMGKQAAVIKAADDRQSSPIPFVEIISDGYDPELGVQLQLDWNAAFIKELASKGYQGRNDRDIVNKWLTAVHKQLANEFEEADRV